MENSWSNPRSHRACDPDCSNTTSSSSLMRTREECVACWTVTLCAKVASMVQRQAPMLNAPTPLLSELTSHGGFPAASNPDDLPRRTQRSFPAGSGAQATAMAAGRAGAHLPVQARRRGRLQAYAMSTGVARRWCRQWLLVLPALRTARWRELAGAKSGRSQRPSQFVALQP